jgi:serine/threonine-protein kinase RsbW
MALNTPPLTLTIPSELRMLAVARGFVEAVCQVNNLDKATTHAIVLATCEAASNVIRHAHRNRPEAQLQIQCQLAADQIEIALVDEGDPFDLAAVPHLDPSEIRVGGRGVFLMRALMDELCTQRRPEGGNTLHMVKRLRRNFLSRDCG